MDEERKIQAKFCRMKLMPGDLRTNLLGFSVDQAIEADLINDIGDEEGNLFVEDFDYPNTFYAIIQGYLVECNDRTRETPVELVGDLVFINNFLVNEDDFRLGFPGRVTLGEVRISLKTIQPSVISNSWMLEMIPPSLARKLHGLTINAAIQSGIINDLGDHVGNFIFEDYDHSEDCYAIVQGYLIKCSKPLVLKLGSDYIDQRLGDLTFFKYEMDDAEEYRLCKPYLSMGDALVNIKEML